MTDSEFEDGGAPEWAAVFHDLNQTFKEQKEDRIVQMFKDGTVDRDDIIGTAGRRHGQMVLWLRACQEIHDRWRFGYRDVEPGDTFVVSWRPGWDGASAQWFLSTAVQFLVREHNDGVSTQHLRPERNEEDEYIIKATEPGRR
jgi:hypothetical protein